MNEEQGKQRDRFMRIQEGILSYLAATYHAEQEKANVAIAHDWRPAYVVLTQSTLLVPRNDRRGKIYIWNDGASDVFIANTHIPNNGSDLILQLNGASNQVLDASIITNGDKFDMESQGPIYACPVTPGGPCKLRVIETLFSTWPNTSPVLGDKGKSGRAWNGADVDEIPNMPNVHKALV